MSRPILEFLKTDTLQHNYHFVISGDTESPGVYYVKSGRVVHAEMYERLVTVLSPPDDAWEYLQTLTGLTRDGFVLAAYYFNEGYKDGWNDKGNQGMRRFP